MGAQESASSEFLPFKGWVHQLSIMTKHSPFRPGVIGLIHFDQSGWHGEAAFGPQRNVHLSNYAAALSATVFCTAVL